MNALHSAECANRGPRQKNPISFRQNPHSSFRGKGSMSDNFRHIRDKSPTISAGPFLWRPRSALAHEWLDIPEEWFQVFLDLFDNQVQCSSLTSNDIQMCTTPPPEGWTLTGGGRGGWVGVAGGGRERILLFKHKRTYSRKVGAYFRLFYRFALSYWLPECWTVGVVLRQHEDNCWIRCLTEISSIDTTLGQGHLLGWRVRCMCVYIAFRPILLPTFWACFKRKTVFFSLFGEMMKIWGEQKMQKLHQILVHFWGGDFLLRNEIFSQNIGSRSV